MFRGHTAPLYRDDGSGLPGRSPEPKERPGTPHGSGNAPALIRHEAPARRSPSTPWVTEPSRDRVPPRADRPPRTSVSHRRGRPSPRALLRTSGGVARAREDPCRPGGACPRWHGKPSNSSSERDERTTDTDRACNGRQEKSAKPNNDRSPGAPSTAQARTAPRPHAQRAAERRPARWRRIAPPLTPSARATGDRLQVRELVLPAVTVRRRPRVSNAVHWRCPAVGHAPRSYRHRGDHVPSTNSRSPSTRSTTKRPSSKLSRSPQVSKSGDAISKT